MTPFPLCPVDTCSEGDVHLYSIEGYSRFLDIVTGEAQICMNGVFGSVCDDFWDNDDASVICRQLGFSFFGRAPNGEYIPVGDTYFFVFF